MARVCMSENEVPVVSVLMCVYNEPVEWIGQAVDSILEQTFRNFEFIIVIDNPDNASVKDFLQRKALSDARIRIMTNPRNIGLTKSLNVGLAQCRGRYIARMDADDISMPTRFEKQVDYLDLNPQVIVVGTHIRYFGDSSCFVQSDWIKDSNDEIKARMFSGSGFAHPSVMIRASALSRYHIAYDEEFTFGQDYRLWETLYDYGEFANIPEKLLRYRLSPKQNKRIHDAATQVRVNGIAQRIRQKFPQFRSLDSWEQRRVSFKEWSASRRSVLNGTSLKSPYFREMVRRFYFSSDNLGLSGFWYAVRTGDFFRFSRTDKLRCIYRIIKR